MREWTGMGGGGAVLRTKARRSERANNNSSSYKNRNDQVRQTPDAAGEMSAIILTTTIIIIIIIIIILIIKKRTATSHLFQPLRDTMPSSETWPCPPDMASRLVICLCLFLYLPSTPALLPTHRNNHGQAISPRL
jgi:hypothetical protein